MAWGSMLWLPNMPMGPETRVDYCPLFIERVSHRPILEQLDRRSIRSFMESFRPHVWKGECFGKVGKSPKFQKPSGRRWSPQVTLKTRRISQYLIRSKCPHTMEYPCVLGLWSLVSSNQSFFFLFLIDFYWALHFSLLPSLHLPSPSTLFQCPHAPSFLRRSTREAEFFSYRLVGSS